ncbi:MAG: class I tRNA ligase family protein [Chloroflexi bacterium]|nr:class I tRNA ligase family protein [Chloroflexota bacterium]
MNRDATMSEAAGPYSGLDRFACREKLWADMDAPLTIKKEPYTLNVPRSQRGRNHRAMVSKQWFVDAEPMANGFGSSTQRPRPDRARPLQQSMGKLAHQHPPWCISRQLWWGSRPVWYVSRRDDQHIGSATASGAYQKARANSTPVHLEQDPDVLDTWFSVPGGRSAPWLAENTLISNGFYHPDVLETGYDILFFWVARMVMTGPCSPTTSRSTPFICTGWCGTSRGKMSKTIGNVVDPIHVMEEMGHGRPAHFTLLTSGTPGNDLICRWRKLRQPHSPTKSGTPLATPCARWMG